MNEEEFKAFMTSLLIQHVCEICDKSINDVFMVLLKFRDS